MSDIFLIKKPLVTEKSVSLNKGGKYVFIVRFDATKPEVKKAIRSIYKVDPLKVNIINRPPKRKRTGALRGRQSGYKKAIVTLASGQKIDIQ